MTRIALSLALLATGCAGFYPRTTEPAAPLAHIAAAPGEAIVVLDRPSAYGLEGPVANLPLEERWSVVRVLDEHGDPVADLHATEHAVLRMSPGIHELFAASWTGTPYRECIGAMRAQLADGRVYAARIWVYDRIGSRKAGCARIDLVAVPAEERATFAAELARSERVSFLGTRRERWWLLDDLDRRLSTVAQGRLRMTDDPSWPAARSLLHEADGDPSLF